MQQLQVGCIMGLYVMFSKEIQPGCRLQCRLCLTGNSIKGLNRVHVQEQQQATMTDLGKLRLFCEHFYTRSIKEQAGGRKKR